MIYRINYSFYFGSQNFLSDVLVKQKQQQMFSINYFYTFKKTILGCNTWKSVPINTETVCSFVGSVGRATHRELFVYILMWPMCVYCIASDYYWCYISQVLHVVQHVHTVKFNNIWVRGPLSLRLCRSLAHSAIQSCQICTKCNIVTSITTKNAAFHLNEVTTMRLVMVLLFRFLHRRCTDVL